MSEYKLKTNEATALMVNLLCNKLFVLAPLYMKQALENTTIIATFIIFILTFLTWQICAHFLKDGKDLFDIIKSKYTKHITGSIIIIVITVVTSLTLRQYSEGIKIMALSKSPIFFIISFISIGMISGAACGLKSLGKSGGFFVPLIYLTAIIMIFMAVNKEDIYNLFPILGPGLFTVARKSIAMLSMLFEFLIFFFLPPLLSSKEDIMKVGNRSLTWSFLAFAAISGIFSISSAGSTLHSYEPFFRLIKQITVSNSFRSFDSVFLILYCISAFLYLSTMLYFITHLASKLFKIKNKKAIILPVGLIIATVAAINILETYMSDIIQRSYYILWIITFILPLLITSVKKNEV